MFWYWLLGIYAYSALLSWLTWRRFNPLTAGLGTLVGAPRPRRNFERHSR